MSDPTTGGCRCGQVRYKISAEPVTQMICHCSGCYKRNGPYMGAQFYPSTSIELRGAYHRYQDTGGTGCALEILACKDCGGVFALAPEAIPLITVITVNSLDEQTQFRPVFHNWVGSKPAWVTIDDKLPQFEKSVDWEKLGGRPDFGSKRVATALKPTN